jgi:hypothetical protein
MTAALLHLLAAPFRILGEKWAAADARAASALEDPTWED